MSPRSVLGIFLKIFVFASIVPAAQAERTGTPALIRLGNLNGVKLYCRAAATPALLKKVRRRMAPFRFAKALRAVKKRLAQRSISLRERKSLRRLRRKISACREGTFGGPCANGIKDANEQGIDCGSSCPFECPSNWKSGISVLFQGTPGRDFAEEYFYHDKLIDDHKVVYIKDSIKIVMEHNERNSIATNNGYAETIGKNGRNGIQDDLQSCLSAYPAVAGGSCDDGLIRYRIDRDLQNKYTWAGRFSTGGPTLPQEPLYPAYAGPFSFSELNYGPEDPAVKVVGSTGSNGAQVQDRGGYYYRGVNDAFGDEWHTIGYADDDSWLNDYYVEKWASDGKSVLFVVNPKTPLISFRAETPSAQFYTTPAKTNFLPVIHDQTTYLTDGVEIHLTNIMSASPIYYRIDRGPFKPYQGPLNSSALPDGEHSIEYFYDSLRRKTRRLVKNPDYPSNADFFENIPGGHGYLLWPNERKFQELRSRLLNGPLTADYAAARDKHTQWGGTAWNLIDAAYRQGLRSGAPALLNALVAAIEGAEARPEHAAYAKRALMDSQLNIDSIGTEVPTGQAPNPSREMYYHGYYAVNVVYDKAFTYDLLIKHYRADRHPGGITAIEDLKIRDIFAARNLEIMKNLAGFQCYQEYCQNAPSSLPLTKMWDFAEYSGAVVTAMAMPGYDTAYYGTSGYNGAPAAHPWTPYPDYPASWKDALFTYTNADDPSHTARLHGYPNQRTLFNHLDGGLITKVPTAVNRTLSNGTLVTEIPAGAWRDRIAYYSYPMVGHTMQILALVNKLKFGHTYPWLELSFEHANNGTVYGLKINSADDLDPRHFTQFILINEYFPKLAPGAEAFLPNAPDQRFQYTHMPYGLVWHNPEWRDSSDAGS